MIKNHPNEEEQFQYREITLSKPVYEEFKTMTPKQKDGFIVEMLFDKEKNIREKSTLNLIRAVKEMYR